MAEHISFFKTRFTYGVRFVDAHFHGFADWSGAEFGGDAEFDGAHFARGARFQETHFSIGARFDGAQFSGDAGFEGALFGGEAWFSEAQFTLGARFEGAQFRGSARFKEAQFSREAGFDRAQFSGYATFEKAQFSGEAWFQGVEFRSGVSFERAQFSSARAVGPLTVKTELSLREASFSAPILIEVATEHLSLVGAAFQEAASLRVRFAEIALDGSSFMKPSTISFAETAFRTYSSRQFEDDARNTRAESERPRLLSVRLVDLSNLVLGGLDLSACLFQGSHNLEKLRIEGPLDFNLTPAAAWRVHVGRWSLPIWRWTRRQTLAEEHHWRGKRSRSQGGESAGHLRRPAWSPPSVKKVDWVEKRTGQPVRMLDPENLAALYRSLRKGLEGQRNAPGAADFYYGEMEMRRHSEASSWTDRSVLWIYWLFSGYGLRASRALAAFAVIVLIFAMGFWRWGLNHPVAYPTALLRSFESSTSLLRPASQELNEFGQLLDVFLRLIGATLLGLAAFSFRGRIKR